MNMLVSQILAYAAHGKTRPLCKSNKFKYQLRRGIKNLNYLKDQIPY